MVLTLRTCGAYHPHHMCEAPAPHVQNINTQPTRFVIEPTFPRKRIQFLDALGRFRSEL